MTSMFAKLAQECVNLHTQDSWDLDVLMERIWALGASSVDVPVSMEVGAIQEEGCEEHGDVFAACPHTQCHSCKGCGRVATGRGEGRHE